MKKILFLVILLISNLNCFSENGVLEKNNQSDSSLLINALSNMTLGNGIFIPKFDLNTSYKYTNDSGLKFAFVSEVFLGTKQIDSVPSRLGYLFLIPEASTFGTRINFTFSSGFFDTESSKKSDIDISATPSLFYGVKNLTSIGKNSDSSFKSLNINTNIINPSIKFEIGYKNVFSLFCSYGKVFTLNNLNETKKVLNSSKTNFESLVYGASFQVSNKLMNVNKANPDDFALFADFSFYARNGSNLEITGKNDLGIMLISFGVRKSLARF